MSIKNTLAICVATFSFLGTISTSIAGLQGTGRLSACRLVSVQMPSYGYGGGGIFDSHIGSLPNRPDYEGQEFKLKINYYCADTIHTPVKFSMQRPGQGYATYIALKRGHHTIVKKSKLFLAKLTVYKFRIYTPNGGSGGMEGQVTLSGKKGSCPVKKITTIKYFGGDEKGHGALSPCTMYYAKIFRNKAGKLPTRTDQRTRIKIRYKCSRKISEGVLFTMRKPNGNHYSLRFPYLKKGKGKINVSLKTFRAKPGAYLFKFRTERSRSYGISRAVHLNISSAKCPDRITKYSFR